ncbi:MAG: iron dependent repressor [Gemmatimonadetes bacterium]|jgi:DtxR family Mn-dependent transcriptional regulator|nr:iron dependent repressor [Gemmatimonadota bacterium]
MSGPLATLSGPVEDYLKAIYDLERVGEPATTNDIALQLRVSAASVSGMVRRLADQGLITHEPYRGVRLTSDGRHAALRTLRRHRILECYLTEVLGYPWDRVHDEAERLEHAASEELIERMAAALGDPVQDPHGAPIPTRDGRVEESTLRSLAEMGQGDRVRVRRMQDEDAERLRYLAELGIRPGALVRVLDKAPFDGPITLWVDDAAGGATRAIGVALADQVFVEPLSD